MLDFNGGKVVLCEMCNYEGPLKDWKPACTYNDVRCPQCGSTKNEHNREFKENIRKNLEGGKKMKTGNIPVIMSGGQGIAEAWEDSIIRLKSGGAEARTEYDDKDADGKYVHPPSLDATMMIVIEDPASEPAIHRGFPGGLEDLEEYRLEVVAGIKDHWQRDPNDPTDKKWTYTYHSRLRNYRGLMPHDKGAFKFDASSADAGAYVQELDQLEAVAQKVAAAPHTRRAQAITWKVFEDVNDEHAPCLQSLWFRMLPSGHNFVTGVAENWLLNMNLRMRSWDAYDAAFMNLWAFCGPQGIQGWVANRIAAISGRNVQCGRVCAIGDSYHLYGKRRAHFEDNFMSMYRKRTFEERTWTREFAAPIFAEAVPAIMEKAHAHGTPKQG